MAADLIVSIAAKSIEYAVAPIGRPLGYLVNYKKNINGLKRQVMNLEKVGTGIQGLVDAANRNGEHILPNVQDWLGRVENVSQESANFFNDEVNRNQNCFSSRSCPDLKARRRVSRKARKKRLVVDELIRDGKFDRVSYPAPPPKIASVFPGAVEVFESRKSTWKEIIEALKDDKLGIIGVYGMGGVGKTTLVKEVAKQAGEQKLFDEIVMAVVSQMPGVRNIQGEIADELGLKFEEESVSGRARRLSERLKQVKTVLVILDDLWTLLDLNAIGIPYGDAHKCCKILLTSRSRDVCNEMNAHKSFPVEILSDSDAWNLFKKMAGVTVDMPRLHPIAIEVAKRCAGLPIAIITVARALRNKGNHAWSDALSQLRSSTTKTIKGMHANVYSSLELSFNFLENNEVKSCFLLCSFFKEDIDIPVETLARYGMGLRLFQNVRTLEEARNRADTLVDDLKACCLLLDGKSVESIRMHDVVRDFAILKVSNGEHMFSVERPNGNTLNHSTAISLVADNTDEIPDGLDWPKLQMLLLQCYSDSIQVHGNFFQGMKELKVLAMDGMPIPSVPPSIQSLKKLRTLCLERSKLRDISLIGELKDLEILSFIGSNVKRLPKEIGGLTRLRLLDLTDCEELTVIPPNVISKLSQLESLYMLNSFVHWGDDSEDIAGGSNATLGELKPLSSLSALEIHILDLKVFPKDLLFKNLIRFKVYIGSFRLVSHPYPTALKVRLDQSNNITLHDGVSLLLRRAQYLIFEHCPDVLKNALYDLQTKGFANLRGLEVYGNDEIEYLVDSSGCIPGSIFPILEKLEVVSMDNLKEICYGHLPVKSFSELRELYLSHLPQLINVWKDPTGHVCLGNLRTVYVEGCKKLKSLFTQHITRDLGQLHKLHVFCCQTLEEIIANNGDAAGEGTDEIVLPMLKSLDLSLLENLRSFCPETNLDAPTTLQPLFNRKVLFPVLEELHLRELPVKEIWHPQLPADNFSRLRVLRIIRCHNIVTVIPSTLSQKLQNLEGLSIIFCDLVEEVCEFEGLAIGSEHNAASVPLKPHPFRELVLWGLPSLKNMWWNKGPSGFPSLKNLNSLTITGCNELKYLFSLSASKGLIQLQRLDIESCDMMKEIVAARGGNDEEGTVTTLFPHLLTLRLYILPELTTFYQENYTLEWPSLKTLTIANCPRLKSFPASEFGEVDQQDNIGATLQPFLCEKVAFPKMEELHIMWMDTLFEIWHDQLPEQTFSRLQVLDVRGCDKLLHIGPTNMLPRLQMLEKFYIEDCVSLQEVFVPEGTVLGQEYAVVTLNRLTELRLKSLPKLRHIWWDMGSQGTRGFRSLRSLEISGCDSLKYVFSLSIARGLVQLENIKVHSCEMMKEIVPNDRDEEEPVNVLVFPQASTLELENLPNLMSFCSKTCAVKWPSLKELWIVNCPKMRTFTPTSSQQHLRDDKGSEVIPDENLPILVQPFFNKKVAFPKMEELHIQWMDTLFEIWHDQLPEQTFSRLQVLDVRGCDKLLHIGPTNTLPRLQMLEKLYIEDCVSLQEVFVHEGTVLGQEYAAVTLNRLTELRLKSLPKLRHIWWDMGSQGTRGFRSLRSLEISGCDSLKYVFSPSIARGLVQLENIKVHSCEMMKEIVPNDRDAEEHVNVLVFPQASTLELENLPNLISFCSKTYAVKWPSLKELWIVNCPKMRTFTPISSQQHLRDDEGLEVIPDENLSILVQPFFNKKVAFPKMEELHVQWMDTLFEIWHDQLPEQTFSRLQVLDVRGCDKLLHIGPTNTLPRLQMLEKLYIEDCVSLQEVFVPEGIVLGQEYAAVTLNRLTELRLKSLPKLRYIWWEMGSQGTRGFRSLRSLEISGCDSLKYVLSPSIARDLVQLENIKVHSCEMMKEIVPNDRDVKEPVNVLVFPQASTLELENLPNLTSFCTKTYAVNWPSLKDLRIVDCPKMRTFTPISSQQHLRDDEGLEVIPDENLPIHVQPFFNKKALFPSLEELRITGLRSLKELWHNQLPAESFCQLKVLKVKNCEKLLKLVSSNLLPKLKNLEKLSVQGCDLVEEILELDGLAVGDGYADVLVSQIKALKLHGLPKLVEMWWNNDRSGILGCPNLSSLKVINCDGLRNLLLPSVVERFTRLEELYIANCSNMEEVVAKEEEEYSSNKVVFPQVDCLGLVGLPNLRSFCRGNYTFEWLSLKKMNLEDCPSMRTFSSGLVITPKLDSIEVGLDERLWKGDVNSTIQHLFEVKV